MLKNLLSRLVASRPDHQFHLLGTMFNCDILGECANLVSHSFPLSSFWRDSEALLARERIDVLFRSYPVEDPLTFPVGRQVVFVPDLQHEQFPQFFGADELASRRRSFAKLVPGAGAVATLSEYCKSRIAVHYPNKFDDVFLIQPACDLDPGMTAAAPGQDFLARVMSLRPFFFFPANLWPHKNHAVLLRAFEQFRSSSPEHPRYSLVLTGFGDWPRFQADNGHVAGVEHLGFVSAAQLGALFREAAALVFPSLYEGFGIPVLEAFALGCPVVCSGVGSLPEVAGDGALLIDPKSPADIADKMAKVADQPDLASEIAAKGQARARQFTWERSVDALGAALARVKQRAEEVSRFGTVREAAPRVSIVTPSFNQGRFIARTIRSVLDQSYPNIEFVVVDGGSTDDTVAVLRSFGDRLSWVSEPDRGQTHAINKGFATATGAIRAYLNSDDTLLPKAVETVVDQFIKQDDLDLVYGDADYIDEMDKVTGTYATAGWSFERLMQDCCICQPAAFWSARIAERVGAFDERLRFAMDYDYWLRIARQGGVVHHLPVRLAQSRLHSATKTLSFRSGIYGEIFDICMRHGGYVSRSYVHGYVHHLAHERKGGLHVLSRMVPGSETAVLEYMAARMGNPPMTRRQAARRVLEKVQGRFRRAAVAAMPSRLATPSRHVRGVWSDGWIERSASFSTANVKAMASLRLHGRVAVDCRVTVTADGKVLLTKALNHGSEAGLEFAGRHGRIELAFDGHHVDAAGRPIAFLISRTNLFNEQEL